MKQLTFIIGGQELTRTDTLEIVSDAIGQFEAVFTFDAWWDGYTPTAQFTKDGKTIDCVLENNKCIVPPEALQKGGIFYVSVFSTDGTGDRKTANEVAVPLKTSGYKNDGSHSIDPTPTVYEQLLADIKEIKENGGGNSVVNGDGVVASPNADFAEVAEWSDGNPDNEDRIGYFVCFDVPTSGIIMRKANADDDAKGVTVAKPSFAGNCTEDKFDENGKLLPQYEYVGVIGLVPVHDNGDCIVGGRCIPADGGIAKPSPNDKGYQVVERYNENMVLIAVEPNGDMVCRLQMQIDESAKQNEVVAKDLKNQLHGVRLTYSHNIDNHNQPKIEKTYNTTTTTGERTYFATFSYWCTLADIEEDAETKEKNFIPRLTNIPPLNYWIDGDGHERYDYNCEFTKEYLILDYSKIDETSTLKEAVDLSALEELVIELGGTLRRTIRKDYMNSNVWTIVYEYTATFKDEATWDTFYNEFLMLAKLGTEAFISEYTYLSEPMELTAEVIENA